MGLQCRPHFPGCACVRSTPQRGGTAWCDTISRSIAPRHCGGESALIRATQTPVQPGHATREGFRPQCRLAGADGPSDQPRGADGVSGSPCSPAAERRGTAAARAGSALAAERPPGPRSLCRGGDTQVWLLAGTAAAAGFWLLGRQLHRARAAPAASAATPSAEPELRQVGASQGAAGGAAAAHNPAARASGRRLPSHPCLSPCAAAAAAECWKRRRGARGGGP